MSYKLKSYHSSFQPTATSGLFTLEAAEVLDRMREGADRLRNNTNSFLSGELLGLVPVRISVSGEADEQNSLRIRSAPRTHVSAAAAVATAAAAAVTAQQGKPWAHFHMQSAGSVMLPSSICKNRTHTFYHAQNFD